MKNNRLVMFAVLVIAVTGGQFALKYAAAFLPDGGVPGALKTVFGGAGFTSK